MTKFIRNNQKKLMAFFGVFLMIAFVATTGTGRQGGVEQPIGTYNHGKATLGAKEYQNLSSEWQFLKRHFGQPALSCALIGIDHVDEQYLIKVLGDPSVSDDIIQMAKIRERNPQLYFFYQQQEPQIAMFLDAAERGSQIYSEIEAKDDMFALLVKDAELQGIGVNQDLIESILAARQIGKDSEIYAATQQSLRSLLLVCNAASRAASVVKVSRPEIANLRDSRLQQMSVNVLEFPAKDFIDKVPAPTTKQLQEQFDKYKDKLAGGTGLDFGYKYPNRVSYDAVEVRREDAKKGVAKINSEDAADYYWKHRNESQFVSSTMPSSRPAEDFTLSPGPTTRVMTFEEAKPKIIQTLTDERTTELLNKVRDAIRDTMKADYESYKVAIDSKTATAPTSSLGVPYKSKEYLSKLKDKILADYKVEVRRIEREEGLRTSKELNEPRQKKELFSTAELSIPFATYMTTRLTPFFKDPKAYESARGEKRPVAEWEPTPVFDTPDHDAYLVARATKAEASHVPASMDEVKDKVTEDYKLAAADELAKKAAEDALAAAKKPKWLYTVAADEGRKAFTTELFGPTDARMGAMLVPGYEDLKGEAVTTFRQGAEKLLTAPRRSGNAPKPATTRATTQASTKPTTRAVASTAPTSAPVITDFSQHPVTLIDLPTEAKFVVAELDQLKPLWTKDQEVQFNTAVASQERTSTELVIRLQWFNYDQLLHRLDWNPTERRSNNKPANQPPPEVPLGS